MENNLQELESESQVQKDTQTDSEKSTRLSLPVFTLNESLAFCIKIYTELGVGSYHSKDLIAEAHGLVYNSIKQRFSTAQAYGLLDLKYGVGYKLTPLFLKIHKPETDFEKSEGILESLRTTEVYSKLIDEFNGHPLPSEQGLAARLLRTFAIKDYAAPKVAQIFLTNLKNSGFLDSNNVLKISIGSVQNKTRQGNGTVTIVDPIVPPPPPPEQPGYIEIPIPLSSGKRAYIKIPEDYKPEDCERIAKFVEALK